MARRDDFTAMAEPAKAPPTRPIMAYVTTRVLVTEREPLYADPEGTTIGGMIDRQLAALAQPPFGPAEGWVAPVVHSVTVELPQE